MRPLYIFDLDGTLALLDHRLHFVKRPPDLAPDAEWTPDWRGFFAAVGDDQPNWPVIRTLHGLRVAGAEVWIWSGRSDECERATCEWLSRFACMPGLERLQMRKEGDHRDDAVVKAEWLADMSAEDRQRLVAVFDDRDRAVAMWRAAGVACFQVAPGAF